MSDNEVFLPYFEKPAAQRIGTGGFQFSVWFINDIDIPVHEVLLSTVSQRCNLQNARPDSLCATSGFNVQISLHSGSPNTALLG